MLTTARERSPHERVDQQRGQADQPQRKSDWSHWCEPQPRTDEARSFACLSGSGLTLDTACASIRTAARQLPDPAALIRKQYVAIASEDTSLATPNQLTELFKREQLGWFDLCHRAFEADPELADPHQGQTFTQLAEECGVRHRLMHSGEQTGALRAYRRFGRLYSRRDWVEDWLRRRGER